MGVQKGGDICIHIVDSLHCMAETNKIAGSNYQFSSVQFSQLVMSNSLQPLGLQHARLPAHHQLLELAQTHIHRVGDVI